MSDQAGSQFFKLIYHCWNEFYKDTLVDTWAIGFHINVYTASIKPPAHIGITSAQTEMTTNVRVVRNLFN